MSFFDDAVGQYIDANGKTIILIYTSGTYGIISLFISPIPPLNLDVIDISDIKRGSPQSVLKFIKEKSLVITEQDVQEIVVGKERREVTKGFWVSSKEAGSGIFYGYIGISVTGDAFKYAEDVPVSDRIDPIGNITVRESELEKFRRDKKMAEILKQYTLYTYSLDPESFGEDSFVIIEDHNYHIDRLKKKMFKEGNEVIYRNDKIIVQSEAIKMGLLSYFRVSLLDDAPTVKKSSENKTIDNYYQSISDFRNAPGQLIFANKNGLLRWKNETLKRRHTGPMVSPYPLPENTDPYYYRNANIRHNKLMIIQNVKDGDILRALEVSDRWRKRTVNSGFDTPQTTIQLEEASYYIFSESGEVKRNKGKTKDMYVFKYDRDGNEEYAAIIFFN